MTLLLWVMFFMNLLDLYFLNSWLPTVMNDNGIPAHLARFADLISVIVQMSDAPDGVHLSLLKDHDNPNVAKLTLDLDPSTMLLVKK